MPKLPSVFTWDGSYEDLWLPKLGFLSSINDVTHHSKFTATTELQDNTRYHGGTQSKITLFAYLNFLLK